MPNRFVSTIVKHPVCSALEWNSLQRHQLYIARYNATFKFFNRYFVFNVAISFFVLIEGIAWYFWKQGDVFDEYEAKGEEKSGRSTYKQTRKHLSMM